MFFFNYLGSQGAIITIVITLIVILGSFAILYSVYTYRKPGRAEQIKDTHHEVGIPVILKGLYLGFLLWMAVIIYVVWKLDLKI